MLDHVVLTKKNVTLGIYNQSSHRDHFSLTMNVFGGTRGTTRGIRGPRGFPGRDALELCYYLPNTISRSLRENEQQASYVLTSKQDCEMKDNKVKKWKNKRIDPIQEDPHLTAVKPSMLSQIAETSLYALDFPGQYKTVIPPLDTTEPYGYFCITFCTSSHAIQTLIQNEKSTEHASVHEYVEISVTNSDISIHGFREGKLSVEPIVHDTTKWTTLYLEWSATPNYVQYTYNLGPDSQGSFQMDPARVLYHGFTVGSRVDGTQPFSGQIHAIENNPSQHPVPDLIKNLVISRQNTSPR